MAHGSQHQAWGPDGLSSGQSLGGNTARPRLFRELLTRALVTCGGGSVDRPPGLPNPQPGGQQEALGVHPALLRGTRPPLFQLASPL